jgi:PAS domain S-box-containing protein
MANDASDKGTSIGTVPGSSASAGSGIPELYRLHALLGDLVGPEIYGPIVESLPDALVVIDESGDMILVNRQAELLLGYHRSELLGHKVEIIVPEAARGRHIEHRNGFIADPRSRPMAVDLPLAARHKSGRSISVRINLSPIVASTGMYVAAVIRRRETLDAESKSVASCPYPHSVGAISPLTSTD